MQKRKQHPFAAGAIAAITKELRQPKAEQILFSRPGRMTEWIQEQLPIELQVALWLFIDLRRAEGHYVGKYHSFRLTVKNGLQKVVHTQRFPFYQKTYWMDIDWPENSKVIIADNGKVQTMKYAQER